ncbi:MAG: tetratricopeptide repeat protein [Candidatus Nomurabacteria bacterium]
MLSKTNSRIFLLVSFVLSLFSLSYFSFFRIPFVFKYLSVDSEKNFIFLILALIAAISFTIYLITKKQIVLPENKYVKWLFLIIPGIIIISSIFSGNLSNAFFGKNISIQNTTSLLAIVFLAYIVAAYLKKFKSFGWIMFMISNFLFTIPVILAIILSKFGLVNFANKLVTFVDSWDTVAIVSGIIVVVTLVYFETIAFSKKQKVISSIIIFLHLLLILCIIIPDIWYALTLSSFGVMLISKFINKNKDENKKCYKTLSFYVFIFSLLLSIILSLTTTRVVNNVKKFSNFSAKYSGINYNFIKPRFGVSLDIGLTELKKGKIFGAGPASFNNVWEKEKPASVISSSYWNTVFVSSYSALTTLFVTVGIVGILAILSVIAAVFLGIYISVKKYNKNSELGEDGAEKFYFISSIALFVFSTISFLVFTNVSFAIILFALSTGLVISNITSWKEKDSTKITNIIFLAFALIILLGFVIAFNRVRSTSLSVNALTEYKQDNDIAKLEINLVKAAKISGDDNDYRTLTQFYVFKAQQVLNTTSASTTADVLQKNILSDINNAISSAKTAISVDDQNYNNYLTLASIYNFLMSIGGEKRDMYYKEAKDNYGLALNLYPKNPSIPLTVANLEYSYNQNPTTTLVNIKQSLSIKPNYSSAYYTLSQLAAKYNDRNSAILYAGQAIQTDPQNVDAYLQYGILTLNKKDVTQNDLNQAYTAFVSVLSIDPNNVTAAYYLSITYILAKDYDHAQALITALTKVTPNDQKITDLQSFLNSQKGGTSTPAPATKTSKTTKK